MQRVLRQVKLTALPRHAGEAGLARLLQSGVSVADDVAYAMEAALWQRSAELAPVNLGFRQRDAHAQNGPRPVAGHADGDQHG